MFLLKQRTLHSFHCKYNTHLFLRQTWIQHCARYWGHQRDTWVTQFLPDLKEFAIISLLIIEELEFEKK